MKLTKPAKIVIIAIIIYIVIFSIISIWKLENFHYNSLDLAIINQAFFNSTQGDFFASSIHPPSYLGDHFNPILFLLLPFYFLHSSPLTLLILQTIILALSAWPIYMIAKKMVGENWAVLLSVAWLLNPFVQNINLFEFHFLPFAIFFILFSFYFWQKEKFWFFGLFAILALLVREDVSLIIFMFGIIGLIQKRSVKWILSPIIISAGYFIAAMNVIGSFAPAEQYKFLIYYSWLGQTPTEALETLKSNPLIVGFYLLRPNNIIFTLGLLMPFFFVPLISPLYLLLGAGIFLQLILDTSGGSQTILQTHYSSLLLPALFIATIYSLKTILLDDPKSKTVALLRKHQGLFVALFLITTIYSSLSLGPLTGIIKAINTHTTASKQAHQELLSQIPKDASVAATYSLLTNLSSRQNVYSLNYAFLGKQQFLAKDYELPEDTQYLLIDFQDLVSYELQYGNNPFYNDRYQNRLESWDAILEGYGIVEIKGSIFLFQKNTENKFTALRLREGLDDKTLENFDYTLSNDQLEISWLANDNYFVKINNKLLPLGYGLSQTEKYKGNSIIATYWLEEELESLEIVKIISGGLEVNEIRSTSDVIDELKVVKKLL